MVNVFVFHGSNGNPSLHWCPWLKRKLEEQDCAVYCPQMPVGSQQNLENWLAVASPFKKQFDNSVVVGHSLSAPFALHLIETSDVKFRNVFLISGFTGSLEVEGEPNLNGFSNRPFDWPLIESKCENLHVIHSDDDPYVPLEYNGELAKKLHAQFHVIKSGKHFQSQSGHGRFDLLLNLIVKNLHD